MPGDAVELPGAAIPVVVDLDEATWDRLCSVAGEMGIDPDDLAEQILAEQSRHLLLTVAAARDNGAGGVE